MNEELHLNMGDCVTIVTDPAYKDAVDADHLWLDYENITSVVTIGTNIYVDDGLISLLVEKIGELR